MQNFFRFYSIKYFVSTNGVTSFRFRHGWTPNKICYKKQTQVHLLPETIRTLKRTMQLNSLAGGIIFSASDLMAQAIESNAFNRISLEKQHINCEQYDTMHLPHMSPHSIQYDVYRNITWALEGMFLNGMLLTPFYTWLDYIIGDTTHIKHFWPGVLKKIVLTQVICTPLFIGFVLYVTPCILRVLHSKDEINYNSSTLLVSEDSNFNQFLRAYKLSWIVWPISGGISFGLIPLQYRPLWDSLVDFFWIAYLSLLSPKDNKI